MKKQVISSKYHDAGFSSLSKHKTEHTKEEEEEEEEKEDNHLTMIHNTKAVLPK